MGDAASQRKVRREGGHRAVEICRSTVAAGHRPAQHSRRRDKRANHHSNGGRGQWGAKGDRARGRERGRRRLSSQPMTCDPSNIGVDPPCLSYAVVITAVDLSLCCIGCLFTCTSTAVRCSHSPSPALPAHSLTAHLQPLQHLTSTCRHLPLLPFFAFSPTPSVLTGSR